MKKRNKIRHIAMTLALCAGLTACGGAEQTEAASVTYTMAENDQNTTVVSDIYAAPVETVTWGNEEGAKTPTDGYCLLKSEKCFVDINGNKLEVEFEVETN